MITIRLEGSEELQMALRNVTGEVREAVSQAVLGTALELQGDVVKSIQHGAKSGRVYRRRGVVHQASAPGQPPASDTGRLASSIEFEQISDLTASVGSALIYAKYLEYGTSRMAARPFFRPAVERIKPKFQQRLERAVGRAIK